MPSIGYASHLQREKFSANSARSLILESPLEHRLGVQRGFSARRHLYESC